MKSAEPSNTKDAPICAASEPSAERKGPQPGGGSTAQRRLQALADGSPRVAQLQTLAESMNGSAVAQPKLYTFQTSEVEAIDTIADALNGDVDFAKEVVDSNPTLAGVSGRDGGYLLTWRNAFANFTGSGQVPSLFYARYGYAIETIATKRFKSRSYGSYEAFDQVTYGATRPDIVIREKAGKKKDAAWLDITSEGSPGHIFNKQGGGWSTKPYVAEVRYDMPRPGDFAKTAKEGLSEEQRLKLAEADASQAAYDASFAAGRDKMAPLMENALEQSLEGGQKLSKSGTREIVHAVCKSELAGYANITVPISGGVMANMETLSFGKTDNDGGNWARWAFQNIDRQSAIHILAAYGSPRKREEGKESEEADVDMEEENSQ